MNVSYIYVYICNIILANLALFKNKHASLKKKFLLETNL